MEDPGSEMRMLQKMRTRCQQCTELLVGGDQPAVILKCLHNLCVLCTETLTAGGKLIGNLETTICCPACMLPQIINLEYIETKKLEKQLALKVRADEPPKSTLKIKGLNASLSEDSDELFNLSFGLKEKRSRFICKKHPEADSSADYLFKKGGTFMCLKCTGSSEKKSQALDVWLDDGILEHAKVLLDHFDKLEKQQKAAANDLKEMWAAEKVKLDSKELHERFG